METPLNDEGFVHISSLPSIQFLSIPYSEVSDASVHTIKQLPNLIFLDADETKLSEDARTMLEEHVRQQADRTQ